MVLLLLSMAAKPLSIHDSGAELPARACVQYSCTAYEKQGIAQRLADSVCLRIPCQDHLSGPPVQMRGQPILMEGFRRSRLLSATVC